jgi:hypothetical protein
VSVRWIAERRRALVLGALVAVPMIFTAIALLPELTIPVPSNNDDATHLQLIQRASQALASGENVLDHWVPQFELGFPWFIYYQPLPALVVVALQRALLGLVDLLTVFNAVRYVLLVGFPLTVFWSLRRMGIPPTGAALAAAVAPLLSGDFRYGFDYDSYIWRGFGMFTQLSAMHLSFVTLAMGWQALQEGGRDRLVRAALALSALVLTHLLYSYMMAITLAIVAIVGVGSRADVVRRLLRLVGLATPAAFITAWLWLPFTMQAAFFGLSPYLQPEKYDSYGAQKIIGWLITGDLLDHGRLPVITALVGLGVAAAAITRTRLARSALALFLVWLILYFGRPTLDGLVSLLPMSGGLLLHRFIGSVELFAIVLVGIGGAWAFDRLSPGGSVLRFALVGTAALVLLVPAMAERSTFYSYNTTWMRQTMDAINADVDARTIVASLRDQPPARVFAGLRSTGYGPQMNFRLPFNSARFSDLLLFDAFDVVAAPYASLSLNADLFWDFAIDRPEDYQLFNVRYVVAPTNAAVPSFLTPLTRTSRYILYSAPGTGYAIYGALIDRQGLATQRDLFALNRPWFNGPDVAGLRFHHVDFPASTNRASAETSGGCPDASYSYERGQPSRIDLLVSCPNASTLVLKVTYHPNWHVTVDGREAAIFMVSPSLVGVSLDAGSHFLTAEYRSTPLKTPLVIIGGVCLAAAFGYLWRERLAWSVTRLRRSLPHTGVGRALLGHARSGLRPFRRPRA